jgi:ribosomal protein L33
MYILSEIIVLNFKFFWIENLMSVDPEQRGYRYVKVNSGRKKTEILNFGKYDQRFNRVLFKLKNVFLQITLCAFI